MKNLKKRLATIICFVLTLAIMLPANVKVSAAPKKDKDNSAASGVVIKDGDQEIKITINVNDTNGNGIKGATVTIHAIAWFMEVGPEAYSANFTGTTNGNGIVKFHIDGSYDYIEIVSVTAEGY